MNMTINTEAFNDLANEAAPLYFECQGQRHSAWLFLNEQGECSLEILGPMEIALNPSVRNHRTLTWPLPEAIKGYVLQKVLTSETVLQLLQRLHDGHEVEWDGQNWSGQLDEDAQEADAELEQILECEWDDGDLWSFCSADEWLSEFSLSEVWPVGKNIEEAAADIIRDAAENDTICGTAVDVESALREKLRVEVSNDEDFKPTPEQLAALEV